MQFLPSESFAKYKQDLIGKGIDFDEVSTTLSRKVEVDGEEIMFSDRKLSQKELGMINEIRRDVRGNIDKKGLEVPPVNKYIMYQRFRSFEGVTVPVGGWLSYNKPVKYDIVKAYYSAANKLGYLSDRLYNKYIGLPKHKRQMLIGSIATKRIRIKYRQGKMKEVVADNSREDEEVLRAVFFHIADHIDHIMYEVSELCKEDLLFYWVDGIYLENDTDHVQRTIEAMEDHSGLTFDRTTLDKIDFKRENSKYSVIYVHETGKDGNPKMSTFNATGLFR